MISQHMHQLGMLSQELIATNGLPSMSGSSGVVSTPSGVAGEVVVEEVVPGGLGFEPMLLLLVVFGGIILFSMFGGRKGKEEACRDDECTYQERQDPDNRRHHRVGS